jgi:hypothetical protein
MFGSQRLVHVVWNNLIFMFLLLTSTFTI